MTRTVYGRVVTVLVAVFISLFLIFVGVTFISTRLYQEEVMQRLNLELADHIVKEELLITDGRVDRAALEQVFHMMMVINPSIELYCLDVDGRVLAYSAPPGAVVRQRLSLEPIHRMLAGDVLLPLRGDDPRHERREKIFSVAPIRDKQGRLAGYLYVVLAGEQYDSVVDALQRSQVLRLTFGTAAAALVFAFIAAVVTFNLVTRRLRKLMRDVDDFRRDDFATPIAHQADAIDDDIGALSRTIHLMSDRLIEQLEQLRRIDAQRRELVANVSHDLRTPLASLQGYLDTLRVKRDTLDPAERDRCLDIAARQTERLGTLVGQLFELSKLEANEAKPHFEHCSMAELVQDVLQKFELRAADAGVSLGLDQPEELPQVSIDIAMMERVLSNLIENAVEHTPRGGRVAVKVMRRANGVEVQVSDTGRGIAAEDLPFVFDRFYRGGLHDTSRSEGAGLGLAIARRIVELHGSTLRVSSRVGEGTTFAFEPPLLQT
jgi:two-component system, OmpR family, sensor kinase